MTMRPTRRLRELLAGPDPVMAPGVADPLFARLVVRHGFDAIYMTGAGTSAARLGMPDVGLLTMTEMVAMTAIFLALNISTFLSIMMAIPWAAMAPNR